MTSGLLPRTHKPDGSNSIQGKDALKIALQVREAKVLRILDGGKALMERESKKEELAFEQADVVQTST